MCYVTASASDLLLPTLLCGGDRGTLSACYYIPPLRETNFYVVEKYHQGEVEEAEEAGGPVDEGVVLAPSRDHFRSTGSVSLVPASSTRSTSAQQSAVSSSRRNMVENGQGRQMRQSKMPPKLHNIYLMRKLEEMYVRIST